MWAGDQRFRVAVTKRVPVSGNLRARERGLKQAVAQAADHTGLFCGAPKFTTLPRRSS